MLTGVEMSVIYIALTYLRSFTGIHQTMFLCCVYLYCFVCNVGSMASGQPPYLFQNAGGKLLLFCPDRGSTVV